MTSVLLAGAGAVGARAARQLVDTPGVERLLVADRDARTAEAVADAMGDKAESVRWSARGALPEGVGVVACALPPGADRAVAERAVEAGKPCVSAADDRDGIAALLELDASAVVAGVTVAAGCGLAPGLADVLARHAGGGLDAVEEVHVARAGVAGPASVATLRRALRDRPLEWRGGAWVEARRMGPELVWFPDPIGARDCSLATGGLELVVRALPGVGRASLRLAEPPRRRVPFLHDRTGEGSWGAARVEVHGRRGRAVESIVYGVIERTAIAAGTVLAVSAAGLGGALAEPAVRRPGVHGLGELVEPVAFLGELARRGVRVAVFEGVAVA